MFRCRLVKIPNAYNTVPEAKVSRPPLTEDEKQQKLKEMQVGVSWKFTSCWENFHNIKYFFHFSWRIRVHHISGLFYILLLGKYGFLKHTVFFLKPTKNNFDSSVLEKNEMKILFKYSCLTPKIFLSSRILKTAEVASKLSFRSYWVLFSAWSFKRFIVRFTG